MGQLISPYDKDYIIEPFTIDNKCSVTLDDAFSISIDDNNNIFLNIHVSLIGFEFVQEGYNLDDLWKETRSIKIREYLGKDITSDYSLLVGKRRVLTLKIKKSNITSNVYHAKCEEIEVANNFWYTNVPICQDFLHYANQVLPGFTYENSHEIVTNLMGYYSSALSEYLYNNMITYMIKTNFYSGDKYQKGNFTSPMRKRDSLINQFIFLKYIENIYNNFATNILLSDERQETPDVVKERVKKMPYIPRRINNKD